MPCRAACVQSMSYKNKIISNMPRSGRRRSQGEAGAQAAETQAACQACPAPWPKRSNSCRASVRAAACRHCGGWRQRRQRRCRNFSSSPSGGRPGTPVPGRRHGQTGQRCRRRIRCSAAGYDMIATQKLQLQLTATYQLALRLATQALGATYPHVTQPSVMRGDSGIRRRGPGRRCRGS